MAKFFCAPKPGHGRTKILSVNRRANSTVRSVLHASTTTISSAQATDTRQSAMFRSSLSVITTAVMDELLDAVQERFALWRKPNGQLARLSGIIYLRRNV